jgi:hypothetical protein
MHVVRRDKAQKTTTVISSIGHLLNPPFGRRLAFVSSTRPRRHVPYLVLEEGGLSLSCDLAAGRSGVTVSDGH